MASDGLSYKSTSLWYSVNTSVGLCVIVKNPFRKFSIIYFARQTTILIFLFFHLSIYSQEGGASELISGIAEELASDEQDPGALELFTDRLQELADDPVPVNSADEDEISRLFFLTPFQVRSLIDYVRNTGSILSVYEIAVIPGFDREITEIMEPFISLKDKPPDTDKFSRIRQTFLTNISVKASDADTSAPGSPTRILMKYRLKASRISAALTGEKDPGEELFPEHNAFPDFVSANICYDGPGFIKRVIIGDYSVRFGQGLNINTGYKTNLSLTSPGNLAGRSEIKPYSSDRKSVV